MPGRQTYRDFRAAPRWLRVAVVCTGAAMAAALVFHAAVPRRLFDNPCSVLLHARGGELLGARIAADGQWRFPPADSLPAKFTACLVAFEDRRFFGHRGVDPLALARAAADNLRAGGVVSGGSTITMQLARIARGNRSRNLYEKAVEICWALTLEARMAKDEILGLYAAHAPFGGNVVGVETAAWRYFGRGAAELSWAESALLAVLPNSPALIHPGRNRERLIEKRNGLLRRLAGQGVIDNTEYELACLEPLPDAPLPLPDEAPHLLARMAAEGNGPRMGSSVDRGLQRQVRALVDRYGRDYASNHIHNLAAVVAEVETGRVVAYVGNVSHDDGGLHGGGVDMVNAPRSTGSVLKPLLYAAMLDEGMLLPSTLVADTPLDIDGFAPRNFNRTFHGAVPAHRAIERSLNVPLVRMLSRYNTGRFMTLLKACGMTTLRFGEEHYGASIILGGAEGTLWDMAGMYASLARVMGHYRDYSGRYDPADIHPLALSETREREPIVSVTDKRLRDRGVLSAVAVWHMFDAMSRVDRPEEEAEWQQFGSMKKVAWKTGTSYGGRDAWAIGVTPRYVVGVWAGNASGEGRAGLTGVGNAAPVMFDIFSLLPGGGWFDMPLDESVQVAVCRRSGHRASAVCDLVDTLWMPAAALETEPCPYHRLVHLSPDGRWRVDSSCEPVENIVTQPWFVLPPGQEYYYRNHNADYRPLPPVRAGCGVSGAWQIDVIYPEHNAVIYLPRGFSGERERVVLRAAHARRDAVLYWHIDDRFIGETAGPAHQLSPDGIAPGTHTLTLTDSWGDQRRVSFTVKE